MNIRDGKVFPDEASALAAIQAAEATWVRPTYTRGSFPGATDQQIGTQRLATPHKLENGTWVVCDADHPALRGTPVDIDQRTRTRLPDPAPVEGRSR